jgi:hypothetical protein
VKVVSLRKKQKKYPDDILSEGVKLRRRLRPTVLNNKTMIKKQ